MGNTVKERLKYWPIPFDFYDEPRLIKATMEFGELVNSAVGKLMNQLYSTSYYIEWNDDYITVFSYRYFYKVKAEEIKEIIDYLFEKNYFSKEMNKKYKILTSELIQKQWLEMIIKSKRKATIKPEYNLINAEDMPNNTEDIEKYSEDITQRKKRNKENKEIEVNPISSDIIEFVKDIFIKNTKYKEPNMEYKVLPVAKMFDEIPEPLTEAELKEAMQIEFAKFTEDKSINIDLLIINIRMRTAAIRENILKKEKGKDLNEAQTLRNEKKIIKHKKDEEYIKDKLKEYKIFFENNSSKFAEYEKKEAIRLLAEGKWIQAGSIIERKIEGREDPPSAEVLN